LYRAAKHHHVRTSAYTAEVTQVKGVRMYCTPRTTVRYSSGRAASRIVVAGVTYASTDTARSHHVQTSQRQRPRRAPSPQSTRTTRRPRAVYTTMSVTPYALPNSSIDVKGKHRKVSLRTSAGTTWRLPRRYCSIAINSFRVLLLTSSCRRKLKGSKFKDFGTGNLSRLHSNVIPPFQSYFPAPQWFLVRFFCFRSKLLELRELLCVFLPRIEFILAPG